MGGSASRQQSASLSNKLLLPIPHSPRIAKEAILRVATLWRRAASRRKFDVLLFWSLDRLSREGALETLQHLNRLTSYGIQWRSLTEQYLDSTGMFRDAVISILAVVAKQERVRLSERTLAGLERARKKGKVLGRRPNAAVDASRIKALRAEGQSWGAISRETGLARATCQKAIQEGLCQR